MVLSTQAVEDEEQVEEQVVGETLGTAPSAVVGRSRTVPKTVMEFKPSAPKRVTVGSQQHRLETIDNWQNTIAISQEGFAARSYQNVRFEKSRAPNLTRGGGLWPRQSLKNSIRPLFGASWRVVLLALGS